MTPRARRICAYLYVDSLVELEPLLLDLGEAFVDTMARDSSGHRTSQTLSRMFETLERAKLNADARRERHEWRVK